MRGKLALALWSATVVLAAPVGERGAQACGCFAPPDPANPVVQAGERILFAVDGGQVTAHIQIQYSGDAADFGWLLPLPSQPTLEIGSDEVFNRLAAATAPDYTVEVKYPDSCDWQTKNGAGAFGGASDLGEAGAAADAGVGPASPLVVQDSVGPYDYAVLKADDKTAMLAWLDANKYFVPAGSDAVINPYIHAGAFFLALKLHSGNSTGDIAPIVVHYASDLPMIPITLTSVTSQPRLNVWVWILGAGRAIPRNYYHVVLNDALLDWPASYYDNGPSLPGNYEDLVSAAVDETTGHHAFVTELAAKTQTVKDVVFPPGLYGDATVMQTLTGADVYLGYLRSNGYTFNGLLVSILQKYIQMPANFVDGFGQPVSPANYYYNFDIWFRTRSQEFMGVDLSFDAVMLTADIESKIVKPSDDVAALFTSHPYFTRLYTRLSSVDMNSDPVFSFNPSLPDVSQHHLAHEQFYCAANYGYDGVLTTEQGFVLPEGQSVPTLPAALRIETLGETGPAVVDRDNHDVITMALSGLPLPPGAVVVTGDGCSVSTTRRGEVGLWTLGLALAALIRRRRRQV